MESSITLYFNMSGASCAEGCPLDPSVGLGRAGQGSMTKWKTLAIVTRSCDSASPNTASLLASLKAQTEEGQICLRIDGVCNGK